MTIDDHIEALMRRGFCDRRIARRIAERLAAGGGLYPFCSSVIDRPDEPPIITKRFSRKGGFKDITVNEARPLWTSAPLSAPFRSNGDYRYQSAAALCVAEAPVGIMDEMDLSENPSSQAKARIHHAVVRCIVNDICGTHFTASQEIP